MDAFTRAYIVAALWSSEDDEGDALDSRYDETDLAPETLAEMVDDCAKFQAGNATTLDLAGDDTQNGHDFWLTRNGHGAGFWCRGYPDTIGTALTNTSDKFGSVDLYVGDNGLIYAG